MSLSKWVLMDLIPKGEIEDWIAGIQPYLHKCDIASVKLNIRNCALCHTETSTSGKVQGWYKKQAWNFLLPGLCSLKCDTPGRISRTQFYSCAFCSLISDWIGSSASTPRNLNHRHHSPTLWNLNSNGTSSTSSGSDFLSRTSPDMNFRIGKKID